MPQGRTATYVRAVCADRPEKTNPRRFNLTLGGDHINYPGNTSTKTADITTVKTFFNSVISTPDARFMTGDLKDFYLGTPLNRYKYIRIPMKLIPQYIIDLYNLEAIAVNGFVWAEVRRGMYGLPQAGILANKLLQNKLAPHGYRPVPITPGLWKHDTRDLWFTLVVDDFGVKYTKRDDAEHLMATLQAVGYKVSQDWNGYAFNPTIFSRRGSLSDWNQWLQSNCRGLHIRRQDPHLGERGDGGDEGEADGDLHGYFDARNDRNVVLYYTRERTSSPSAPSHADTFLRSSGC